MSKSGVTGDQLSEARTINRSLSVLSRVIQALGEKHRKPNIHVPYRESRLTFLLQESLGGNSRTTIIANVSPSPTAVSETASTLLFAEGAKKIRLKAS